MVECWKSIYFPIGKVVCFKGWRTVKLREGTLLGSNISPDYTGMFEWMMILRLFQWKVGYVWICHVSSLECSCWINSHDKDLLKSFLNWSKHLQMDVSRFLVWIYAHDNDRFGLEEVWMMLIGFCVKRHHRCRSQTEFNQICKGLSNWDDTGGLAPYVHIAM